jgi:hypothetical protein
MGKRMLVGLIGGLVGGLVGWLVARLTGWTGLVIPGIVIGGMATVWVGEKYRKVPTIEELNRPVALFPPDQHKS